MGFYRNSWALQGGARRFQGDLAEILRSFSYFSACFRVLREFYDLSEDFGGFHWRNRGFEGSQGSSDAFQGASENF